MGVESVRVPGEGERVIITGFGFPPAYLGATGVVRYVFQEQNERHCPERRRGCEPVMVFVGVELDHKRGEIVPLEPQYLEREDGKMYRPSGGAT